MLLRFLRNPRVRIRLFAPFVFLPLDFSLGGVSSVRRATWSMNVRGSQIKCVFLSLKSCEKVRNIRTLACTISLCKGKGRSAQQDYSSMGTETSAGLESIWSTYETDLESKLGVGRKFSLIVGTYRPQPLRTVALFPQLK